MRPRPGRVVRAVVRETTDVAVIAGRRTAPVVSPAVLHRTFSLRSAVGSSLATDEIGGAFIPAG
jgi:hypothetical protein